MDVPTKIEFSPVYRLWIERHTHANCPHQIAQNRARFRAVLRGDLTNDFFFSEEIFVRKTKRIDVSNRLGYITGVANLWLVSYLQKPKFTDNKMNSQTIRLLISLCVGHPCYITGIIADFEGHVPPPPSSYTPDTRRGVRVVVAIYRKTLRTKNTLCAYLP